MARATDSFAPRELSGRCSFCGYDLPSPGSTPEVSAADDVPKRFCSERCRSAFEDGDEPFAGVHGSKRRPTGVSALDDLLPWGIPTNAFTLLSGAPGIRHRELQTELVWRTLTRGEPAVIVSMVDLPIAVVEGFLDQGWNVLPYLESGQLRIVDCFTGRLRSDHQGPEPQTEWNDHLYPRVDAVTTRVEDATDLRAVETRLLEAMDDLEMRGSGIVVIDSLNELETQAQEHRAQQFLQEVRAEVCKRLFVPVFASVTTSTEKSYSLEHSYIFDGIVDMRRDEDRVPDLRLRQLSVRKMDGVSYLPHWVAYENFGDGFVLFDPDSAESRYLSPPLGP